jgi:hypothetical protein
MTEFGLKGDTCEMSEAGFPISRIDIAMLDSIGIRIMSGQTIIQRVALRIYLTL